MSEKMIYLDRNESNYGPAPACFEVLKNAGLTKLSWYTKAYSHGVKSILSERIANDFGIEEKQVVLGYGAEDILKQAVQCYLTKGSKLLIPTYSWWYYKKIADEVEGVGIEYPMVQGEETFYYDNEKMLKIYKEEKPEMVFIASPNNPTGNKLTLNEIKIVLKELQDTIVVLDEAYAYMGGDDYIKELMVENPNLIVVRTFSKYYALAGVRIGYGIIGANLAAMSKFTNRYLGYNRISEEIAIAALDSPDYYREIASKMEEDRNMFFDELNKIEGFKAFRSFANFVLVEIPREIYGTLKEFLLEKGLAIKFMNEDLLDHHLRITLGTQEENKMLCEAIMEYAVNEKMV
ncbi:MAG: histidinol-phosphate aminotransferase family protein [Melioribacteraceae bacterium]|nr:histidinol-phosphate aminotransferase family protein [Melioribacteraceae bacterium]